MKRCTSFLLAVVLLLSLMPTGLFSLTANAETSGYYTYTVSNGEATITDCSSSISGAITIPSTLGGYPVTSIGNSAFSRCQSITSIVIPDGVINIGSQAFFDCFGLTSVTIGDSVTSIGTAAFYCCTNLSDIQVSENNEHFSCDSYGVLFNKDKTELIKAPKSATRVDYTIPDGVVSIGHDAFARCKNLTSVSIPEGVISISGAAFEGCDGLTGITIPDSVTSIGGYVFSRCDSLTSVKLSDGVTSIGERAFYSCTSLREITIPASVTSIGSSAFERCISLGKVTIPASVTSIGNSAFYGCARLYEIIIPDSVIYIEDMAFQGCTSLTSVRIPDGVTNIDGLVFYDCKSLTSVSIPDGVTSIGYSAFEGCTSLTSVRIPDSVTIIGGRAFYNCKKMTSVSIPGGVTGIGDYAFGGCSNLEHVWYSGSEKDKSNLMVDTDNAYLEKATWHYNCCNPDSHAYDNACDTACNSCEYVRTVPDHAYTNSCDTDCNECGVVRSITHTYDHSCDTTCNICGAVRSITHKYSNTCDIACNVCGTVRSITHTYDYICDDTCNVCGYTRDASHIYDNADDVTCNVCKQTLAPAAPKAESVTDNTVTLVAVEGYEYSKDGSTWQKSNVFIVLEPGCSYEFFQRVAQTEDNLASPASSPLSVTTDKRMPDIPEDFTILELTDTSVTLNEITGCEYSVDGINWQANPVFTGLTPGTRYTFYQRIAEGSKNYASDSAVLYITTYSKLGTITYNPNGGKNAPESTTGIVSSTAPTRSGYRFVGWALSPETFAVYSPGDRYSQQEDIVLYASWAKLCDTCDGEVNYKTTCYSCLGSGVGRYTCSSCGGVGYFTREETCSAANCYGGTYVYGGVVKKCSTCKGTGLVTKNSDCTKCSNGKVTSTCRTCWGPGYINRECEQCAFGVQKFTPEAPEMPKLQSISNNTIVLVGYSTCEYSMDERNWQDSNVFSGLDSNTQYVFYQRYKAKSYTDHSDASPALSVTTHRDGVMPSPPPVLQSKTYNQVVLKQVVGCEYSIDGINWQESNTFDGLEPDTQYTIYQRYAETSTHLAGLTSEPLIVCTDAPPYTPGDVNADDKINSLDGLILLRYLNGWDITINSEEAMDVNADGKINSLDGLILMRYLNGWNVSLG